MKAAVVFGLPPMVFVVALAMGWHASAPEKDADTEQAPTQRLSPRQLAQQTRSVPVRSRMDDWESRITRYAAPPPRIDYDAEGMEAAIREDWMVTNGFSAEAVEYAIGWSDQDPEAMHRWLVGKDEEQQNVTGVLFETWAAQDVERALAAASEIPNKQLRSQALMTSLCILSKSDQERASRLLANHLNLFEDTLDDLSFHVDDLSFHDDESYQSHFKLLASLPMGKVRSRLLATLMNDVVDSDKSKRFWNGLSADEKQDLIEAGFAKTHLYKASELQDLEVMLRQHVENTGDAEAAVHLIQNHGEDWMKRDFEGACEWVNANMKGRARMDALETLWQSAAEHDLDQAIAKWRELPQGNFKKEMARSVSYGVPYPEREELLERLLKE